MIDFFIKVKQQEAQNLPFVIFKKSNKKKLVGFFQKNDHLYFAENFKERGFVFAPFDGSQMLLIPKDESVKWETKITVAKRKEEDQEEVSYDDDLKSKIYFEALVQKGIDAISQGKLNKVVVSREEIVAVPEFDLVTVFKKLIDNYPSAFCYCWYHPKIGLWMGATPERLLKANKKRFYTMALAGTKIGDDVEKVVWKSKEKEEQQIVTDFILENIKSITSEVAVSSPYTLQAGKLLHIITDIEGVMNENSNLSQVIEVLHPTPAVCGLPKGVAKEFIIKNENYDRSYYTGFLGELNIKEFDKHQSKSDLYVNLRCMQIINKDAHLYIGCGITKDSVAEKEWKESVNKSSTMKKVL
ncbi:isochorismate synthase [Flavobacterium algicola]|uniref:isochorismate synthase n=1 Tax=Flavobacterium algicola TaxID=556529 RepID=UPI001EFCF8E2|nr:isochorismate synthase [Flavobacterium algicola]MCG9793802.1 isochorismate synthase [Flavobacterium algicola]